MGLNACLFACCFCLFAVLILWFSCVFVYIGVIV